MRTALDLILYCVMGLLFAVLCLAVVVPAALFIIASNWDWEYRS